MKAGRFNGRSITTPRSQRGVVLVIALIILVAMTLAGIGMMRSVDTGSVIAGNMSFRQATMNVSDAGTGTAFTALMGVANKDNLFNDNAVAGYFSAPINPCEVTGQVTGQVNGTNCTATQSNWWTVPANWTGAYTLTAAQNPDPNMQIQYLIHRMCTVPNASITAGGQVCQTYTIPGGSQGAAAGFVLRPVVYYRVTVRVTGPRNTVSMVQALVQQP